MEVAEDMKIGSIKERIAVGMNLRPAALRLLLHSGGRELSDSQTIANCSLMSEGASLVAEEVGEHALDKTGSQGQGLAKTLARNGSGTAAYSKHVGDVGGAFSVFESDAAYEAWSESSSLSARNREICLSSKEWAVGRPTIILQRCTRRFPRRILSPQGWTSLR